MPKVKRITANLPYDLLQEAKKTTHKGITETLVYGLELIRRSSAFHKVKALKGKLRLKIDLEESRERHTR